MNFPMPIVRLELENMRYQVVHAFSQHNKEIEQAVDAEVIRQIKGFNFEVAVHREFKIAMDGAIKSALSDFFGFGRPGEAIIKTAVNKVLKKSLGVEE